VEIEEGEEPTAAAQPSRARMSPPGRRHVALGRSGGG